MAKSNQKRNIHPFLEKILSNDVYMTQKVVKRIEKLLSYRQLKTECKILEISAHGLVWIPCWIGFIWVLNNKDLYQMQVNFFIGLLLDLLLVALIKAFTRRRRPIKSEGTIEIGPDKFSFPSGHASRAFFISFFCSHVLAVPLIFQYLLLIWSVCVSASRLLMRRHHLLDVAVGTILGILESYFIGLIYLNEETCKNLVYWITDEKLDG